MEGCPLCFSNEFDTGHNPLPEGATQSLLEHRMGPIEQRGDEGVVLEDSVSPERGRLGGLCVP